MYSEKCILRSLRDDTKNSASRNYMIDKLLGFRKIEKGIIVPGQSPFVGVVDAAGKPVYGTGLHYSENVSVGDVRKVVKDGRKVLFLGKFYGVWGHCLTDNLKHLWFLRHSNIVAKVSEYQWVYSTVSDPLPSNFVALLSLIGVELSKMEEVLVPTQFSEVLVPDECFMYDPESMQRVCTIDYVDLLNEACRNVSKALFSHSEKIYLSREKIDSDRDFGEETVRGVFEKKGYEVVYPERIELSRLISMLQCCTSLACTEGSVSHNAVFLKEGCEIVILRKARCLNGYQSIINSIKRLNVKYIDANWSILSWDSKNRWKGPFCLCVNRRLTRFAGGGACKAIHSCIFSGMSTQRSQGLLNGRCAVGLMRCMEEHRRNLAN